MSSNEAKQQWEILIRSVQESGDAVIIESHGTPLVAIIPYDEFTEYRKYKETRRRQELLKRLDQIEANYDGRNDDMTEEQINEIAVKIGKEINRAAAERHRRRVAQNRRRS